MKLSDLVIVESVPQGDRPIELKQLTNYFPNTYKKAAKTLAKSGRLMFGDMQVFDDKGEYGPALEHAVAAAEQKMKDHGIEVVIDLNGHVADIDDEGQIKYEDTNISFEETFVGYARNGDQLIIGYDVWLDEDTFNEEFDTAFEKTFGEEFDHDNQHHEKIFNDAYKQWKEISFCGQAVEVDESFHADIQDMPLEKGFHIGNRMTKNRIISFTED